MPIMHDRNAYSSPSMEEVNLHDNLKALGKTPWNLSMPRDQRRSGAREVIKTLGADTISTGIGGGPLTLSQLFERAYGEIL